MIYAITVPVDIQTIDPDLPAKMIGRRPITPGDSRRIPGGMIVFQSAALSSLPGVPSLYRFIVQFGALRYAAVVGNWLFSQLNGTAAALSLAGHLVPIDHHAIIAGIEQVA